MGVTRIEQVTLMGRTSNSSSVSGMRFRRLRSIRLWFRQLDTPVECPHCRYLVGPLRPSRRRVVACPRCAAIFNSFTLRIIKRGTQPPMSEKEFQEQLERTSGPTPTKRDPPTDRPLH